MDNLFLKYTYHLDDLRRGADIKIKDFCEGVCEPRTYRMYINGERMMSQKMLNGFCKKLGITPRDFYSSYHQNDSEEYQKIAKLYNHIRLGNYESARRLLMIFEEKHMVNQMAKNILDYCIIAYNLKTNGITKASAYEKFSNLIGYPSCLSKKTITIQDVLTLHSIADLEFELGEDKALEFLKNSLTDPFHVIASSEHQDVFPTIYSRVSYIYGMKRDIPNSLLMAEKGIFYCKNFNTFLELDRLYYYAFLGHKTLGDIDKRDYYAKKFLSTVYAKYDDLSEIQSKLQVLAKDMNVEYVNNLLDDVIKLKLSV